ISSISSRRWASATRFSSRCARAIRPAPSTSTWSISAARHESCAPSAEHVRARMATTFFLPQVEIPRRLRALVRARETSIVFLASLVGVISGVVVLAMSAIVTGLHALFFALPYGTRLSAVAELDWRLAVAVPCLGGLAFGLATQAITRWRS